jgi:YrbI family 3-deoxy-D-manno-octulosonate 8-phosphate phosphatase
MRNPSGMTVIPARGGSKGIPRKNLQTVGGVPLVLRAIDAAVESRLCSLVLVSTDDDEIGRLAAARGAYVVRRPAAISGDTSSSESAVGHAIEAYFADGGSLPDVTVMAQCTSPFLTGLDIDGVIAEVLSGSCDSCFTAVSSHSFSWSFQDGGEVAPLAHDPARRLPRQALPHHVIETGGAYAFRTDLFQATPSRFVGKVKAYIVDELRAREIDTPEDLEICRLLVGAANGRNIRSILPKYPQALIMDFDGVITDNGVTVNEEGIESIRADRSDGLGIGMLRDQLRLPMLVLSTERNPVVTRRCEKLRVECLQGVAEKSHALRQWATSHGIDLKECIFVGNDINDLSCFPIVGCCLATHDAYPVVREVAAAVLSRDGGHGAVRELADYLIANDRERNIRV